MAPADLSLAVVGADYPNESGPTRRFEIAVCHPGDPVHLVPEPKNPADPRAIMVISERGVLMGYVTAERAPLVGRLMAEAVAVKAIFQEATRWGAAIRVAFDGNEPNLPPSDDQVALDPEPDFYPDDEWPD